MYKLKPKTLVAFNPHIRSSVTRFGDFLKVLGAKFLAKVAQIFSNNFGLL